MSTEIIAETIHAASVPGGEITCEVDGQLKHLDVQTLRNAIPAHCLKPNTLRSFSFVVRDFAIFGALLWGALALEPRLDGMSRLMLCWVVYPYLAGLPLTGLWIIAHEAGHGAFSTNKTIADTVGFILHSALFSPYFAWRSSHHRHHQFANNVATDLNYVPPSKEEYTTLFQRPHAAEDMMEDAPVAVFLRIVLQQVIGWPWYLITHITAGPNSSPKSSRGFWDNSHFLPNSSLFRENEFWDILLSDMGLIAMGVAMYMAGEKFGSYTVMWTYVIPLLWVNHWIVMITYLHHTSPNLPKYKPESWTYLRGALATVDRDPGFLLRHAFHHIIDLHVIHHLFPRVPHYHAQEATNAIKPLLGEHYHQEGGSYWYALWTAFTQCQWVEADASKTASAYLYRKEKDAEVDKHGVLWYRNGRMPRPVTFMRPQEK